MDGVTARTRTAARPSVPENTGAEPLWRRHFALLWSGGALNGLGTMTFTLAVPLLALAQTGSAVATAWIAVAGMLPRILLHAPAGVLVDRVEPRRLMVLAQAGRLAVTLLILPPILLGKAPVLLLAAAMAVHGACSTLFASASSTAVPYLVPREHLADAVGKNEARSHGTQLTGRPLGGFLFGLAMWAPAVFNLVMSAGALLTALLLPRRVRAKDTEHGPPQESFAEDFQTEPAESGPRRESFAEEFRAGFRWLYRDRLLRSTLVVCTVTNAMFQTVWLIIMGSVTDHGFHPMLVGTILAATGVGGLLGSLIAPRLVTRVRPASMVALCLWAWLFPLGALAAAHHLDPWWLMAALPFTWGGIGFIGAHMNVAMGTYRATRVPRHLLGRVLGVDGLFAQGALPLGLICGGYLLEALGARFTSALLATANLGMAVAFTALLAAVRYLPAPPGRPAVAAVLGPARS